MNDEAKRRVTSDGGTDEERRAPSVDGYTAVVRTRRFRCDQKRAWAAALLFTLGGTGCVGGDDGLVPTLPETPFAYVDVDLPIHARADGLAFDEQNAMFPIRDRSPQNNLATDEGTTLGRVLFFDPGLSRNREVSCSSCHVPERGFSDERALSVGFLGGETQRHSMGLTNARYTNNGRYFWDERAATLEAQVLMPIVDEVEMGLPLAALRARVAAQPYYRALFEDAFGDDAVTDERMAFALAQFVRSLVSFGARYDEGRAQVAAADDDFPNFSVAENEGKRLFMGSITGGGMSCVSCHTGEGFVGTVATSNGLDALSIDLGVGGANERAVDEGKFRVPSLRNVAVRAPYMHDGRFASLDEVIDHYSDHVAPHAALSVYVDVQGDPMRFDLSAQQRAALVAFLETLTDAAMLTDEKFQDPFSP